MKKTTTFLFAFVLLLSMVTKVHAYQIGHTQITYTDPARGSRAIQTEIYYPTTTTGTSVPVSAGTFPLIVFGHGFVMAWDAYQNVWEDLVLQGYIVAFPRTEGSFSPTHSEFGKDLAFLVTKMQSESATNMSSLFYNHINSKSAIMGHSMGGGSAFLAAEYNTSITTMVTFAAANTTPSSIAAAAHVSVPTFVIAGENDCVAPPAVHQIKMYDSLGSACKAYISIKGAAHCEFANYNFNCAFGESTCSPSPTITRTQQQDATSDFLKLWLDYYLKDICGAWSTFNDSLTLSPRLIAHNQSCAINNPVITETSGVLTSTVATTYQWYWNGSIIAGATAQTYTPTVAGNYNVEVTYYNACPYPSNIINFTTTGIMINGFTSDLIIYPNPTNDFVTVDFTSVIEGEIKLTLTNVIGQQVNQKTIKVVANEKRSEAFNLNGLEKGVYFMELSGKEFNYVRKVIKK
jgi:dienelactone hydrolase